MGEDVNTRKHSMAVEAVRSVDTVKVYEGKQPNTGKRWDHHSAHISLGIAN